MSEGSSTAIHISSCFMAFAQRVKLVLKSIFIIKSGKSLLEYGKDPLVYVYNSPGNNQKSLLQVPTPHPPVVLSVYTEVSFVAIRVIESPITPPVVFPANGV